MPRTCAGTNRNQLNKTKKREAVEREVRALESAVRAELWPLVFFRISPMAQHEGQRAMAMPVQRRNRGGIFRTALARFQSGNRNFVHIAGAASVRRGRSLTTF